MLALDPGHRLLNVREDGTLEQVTGAALLYQAAEDRLVEGLGDGLSLLLRVRDALERGEKVLAGIDEPDGHAQATEE